MMLDAEADVRRGDSTSKRTTRPTVRWQPQADRRAQRSTVAQSWSCRCRVREVGLGVVSVDLVAGQDLTP